MIKRFNDFLEEGFMTRSLGRDKTNTSRLENKKYKTSLGEEIDVGCTPSDVEEFIEIILNNSYDEGGMDFGVDVDDGDYIYFNIGKNLDDEDVAVMFYDYEDFEYDFMDEDDPISYDDYVKILECIANSIKNTIGHHNVVLNMDFAYVIFVDESDMDKLCRYDDDRYNDNSGYTRLVDSIYDFVGGKNKGFEYFNGSIDLGDEPYYLAVKINEWFIHNFDKLCKFVKMEWNNLINYDYDDEE